MRIYISDIPIEFVIRNSAIGIFILFIHVGIGLLFLKSHLIPFEAVQNYSLDGNSRGQSNEMDGEIYFIEPVSIAQGFIGKNFESFRERDFKAAPKAPTDNEKTTPIPTDPSSDDGIDGETAMSDETNTLERELWKAIGPCWQKSNLEQLPSVMLEISFSPLGNIINVSPIASKNGTQAERISAIDSARVALSACGPYLIGYGNTVKLNFPPNATQ